LEVLCSVAEGKFILEAEDPVVNKLRARKFILFRDGKFNLNTGKDFFFNYILFYRDTLDQEAFRLFDEYFPIELSIHNIIIYDQVRAKAEKAAGFWVVDCGCRLFYGKCDHPLKICLGMMEKYELEGAKKISAEEVFALISDAEQRNLVPAYFDIPDGTGWFCFCCGCCCGPLNKFKRTGTGIKPSEYIESTDIELCEACGACETACQTKARKIKGEVLIIEETLCIGCGVCVDDCPQNAISLAFRGNDIKH
jgi:NAD-dependent dihydropyrimidine dehydrogenase PreA subunit